MSNYPDIIMIKLTEVGGDPVVVRVCDINQIGLDRVVLGLKVGCRIMRDEKPPLDVLETLDTVLSLVNEAGENYRRNARTP